MYRLILAALSVAVFSILQLAAAPSAHAALASFYGYDFAGKPTASGERFNPMALTAASRTLPFGTLVRVTNRANGRSVVVRINDRGPFVGGRSIDLSQGAAGAIGMIGQGVASVEISVVGSGSRTLVASNTHRRHRAIQVAARKSHRTKATQLARITIKAKASHVHVAAFAPKHRHHVGKAIAKVMTTSTTTAFGSSD
jgi:rare lipoprotein A